MENEVIFLKYGGRTGKNLGERGYLLILPSKLHEDRYIYFI